MSKVPTQDLRCPECFAPLSLNGSSFECTGVPTHTYQFKRDIVSFTDDDDFETHWSEHETETIPPSKIDRAVEFLQPVFAEARSGIKVLDVGCGDGVHAAVLRSKCKPNLDYLGVDLSVAALLATSKRVEDIALIRANALNLPLQDDRFDVVFSFGVLGYTGSPERGVHEMARVLKPGGLMGIWLAPVEKGLSGAVLSFVRMCCQYGGRHVTHAIANAIVPFLSVLPVISGVNLGNASWKQCREIVLVNIQPETLIYPSREDVLSWLGSANMEVVQEDPMLPITLWCRAR